MIIPMLSREKRQHLICAVVTARMSTTITFHQFACSISWVDSEALMRTRLRLDGQKTASRCTDHKVRGAFK